MSPTMKSMTTFSDVVGFNFYSPLVLSFLFVTLITFYVFGRIFYNIYLHPLAIFPGPKIAAATRLWQISHNIRGEWIFVAQSLHSTYGPVVRVAPDELSYTDATAWNQIYGHRAGKPEIQKDPIVYRSSSSGEGSILRADRNRHSIMRKALSHGFSERALREQDSVIRGYADLCILRLKEHCGNGNEAVDIVKWLNFFTFDVMGDLIFGESFGCLENSNYDNWVSLLFSAVKFGPFNQAVLHFPLLRYLKPFFVPKGLEQRRANHRVMSDAKAENRKIQGSSKPDLISGFLKPESGITMQEYVTSCQLIILAGSETTATLMSGVTYLLLSNPEKMNKAIAEVRTTFSSSDEITLVSVNKLEYLLACLNESLRMYPPVPDLLPRNTGENVEMICGQSIPPNTVIGVNQYAANRSPENFSLPNQFIPERWLDDPAFAADKKSALQPFSVGPRNCLGRNLAYFEMRLMMTLLLWNYDIDMLPESKNWMDQKAYILWEKLPLMVKLRPRKI